MKAFAYRLAVFAAFLHAAAGLLRADGGAVESRTRVGSLIVTVFGAPAPLRAGRVDLSVMVQTAPDENPVLDADVVLRLSKPGAAAVRITATRAQATNKLLYAAQPVLPSPGKWRLDVQVHANGSAVTVPVNLAVFPPESSLVTYWPYLLIVPAGVLLFILNQWLKSKLRLWKTVR